MWRDDAYLLDMLLAAKRVMEFRSDLTWDQFRQSHLHQQAIAKALENIGEAAGKVSEEIAIRHRIVHDYFRLDLLRVWEVATNDVPNLVAAIEPHAPPE
ncbi:MAG: DUF86 domain-containing protein [Nitrospira sp.]|jgi:uncharacterized protein with HEPN domain|nr:MAG: DUF86 domain-containing protein [Nitrospira sp.]